jgi:carbonic anhydrase
MVFPVSDFADVLGSNDEFVRDFRHSKLTGTAQKGLSIVTCMDSRISPLAAVGMHGDTVWIEPPLTVYVF